MEMEEKMISGESTLTSSLRSVSPPRSPATSLSPEGRYLDVSVIIKSIFPDLDDNSLGERRDQLLKQAEQLEKQRLAQTSEFDSENFESTSNFGSGRLSQSPKPSSTGDESTAGATEIEKDYAEDEQWHRKMMEYLAATTKEFEQFDAQLTRAEQSIIEARGRAASADKTRKAHRLAPIRPSSFPNYLNENFLTDEALPGSLLLPSQFYPNEEPERIEKPVSPRYQAETASTRISRAVNEDRRPTQIRLIEPESRTSSIADHSLSPRRSLDRGDRPKARGPKVVMSTPGVTNRGLCRADEEEHVKIQNDLARMQNVAFDFLKNPRAEKPKNSDIFDAVPSRIVFRKWQVGIVLETILEIRNKDTVSRSVTVLPPENPRFHLGLGRYPSKDGRVGPGLSVSYRVQFMPDTLADDSCEIEVRHPGGSFKVPILAIRDKPVLTIPSPINVGYCLVGGKNETLIRIINQGGPGKFCFVRKGDWPAANFRNAVNPGSTSIGPFTIWPSLFEINTGEERDLVVHFHPKETGPHSETLFLTCDNCQTKEIELFGIAEQAKVQILIQNSPAYLGELYDRYATNRVNFESVVPQNPVTISFGIQNETHIALPFQFRLMKPDLVAFSQLEGAEETEEFIYRNEDNLSPFTCSPNTGLLAPDAVTTVHFTFSPDKSGNYTSIFRLSLVGIPSLTEPEDLSERVSAEFELNGKCVPVVGQLLPPVVDIPGEIPAGSRLKRQIHLMNPSSGELRFEWKSQSSICSVEPAYGIVPSRQMVPLQLCFEAEIPGQINEKLVCSLECGSDIDLTVKASVRPPMVNINIDKVVFGTVEVGSKKSVQFGIDNRNPIGAMWTVDTPHPDLKIDVKSGILDPLNSATLTVTWAPTGEYDLEGNTLNFGGATHSELLIFGRAVRPKVEFAHTCIDLGELFVGVEKIFELEVKNFSPVDAHYRFIPVDLLPSVPEGVKISILDEAGGVGTIPPRSSKMVRLAIVGEFALTLENLILACDVENANLPTLVEIKGQVKNLDVQVWSTQKDPTRLNLNMKVEEVKIEKILIKNVTAIKTNFSVRPEHLVGSAPKVKLKLPDFSWDPDQVDQPKENKYGLSQRALLLKDQPHTKQPEMVRRDFSRQMNKNSKYGVSVIAHPHSGQLLPFECREVVILTTGATWGTYRDNLVISIGDLEPIRMPVEICINSPPISVPSSNLRFGTISVGSAPVRRKMPLTNQAAHPVSINFYILTNHDYYIFKESGHLPDPLDDEDYPIENSPFDQFIHAIGSYPGTNQNPFKTQKFMTIKPNETNSLDITFEPSNQRGSTVNSAVLIGQLSVPFDHQESDGIFHRPSGTFGPVFSVNLTAALESDKFQIEEIDALEFYANIDEIEKRPMVYRKAFSVFNSAGMNSTLQLKIDPPFLINESDTTVLVKLQPHKRQILYATLRLTHEMVKNNEENNFELDKDKNCLKATGALKTTGLTTNFHIPCRAQITFPKVMISKVDFDFETGFVEDEYKREICLENSSTCDTWFRFEVEDEIFEVSPPSGVLKGGQISTMAITFRPKEEKEYKSKIKLSLYEGEHSISATGKGTRDAAFANHLRF